MAVAKLSGWVGGCGFLHYDETRQVIDHVLLFLFLEIPLRNSTFTCQESETDTGRYFRKEIGTRIARLIKTALQCSYVKPR